tara:strand:- start:23 stop:157 length:135 start_codon:yes stop_codon:yes gene_type:complete
MRREAVEKIYDPAALTYIAQEAAAWSLRKAAFQKINEDVMCDFF